MKKNDIVERAILVHSDKYDYSLVVDCGAKNKISIICKKHGEFEQTLYDHLNGHGCAKCAYEYKLNNKKIVMSNAFIEKSKIIYNNYYDYEKAIYDKHNHKVIINCPIHGDFKQTPKNHLKGTGCRKCGAILNNDKEFFRKSNIVHNNKYSYEKSNYLGNKIKLIILCPIHGKFEQTPNDHLSGHGCPNCSSEKNGKLKRDKRASNYIVNANKIHNNKYDYSALNYIDSKNKIIINCPIHGDFNQYPQEHIQGYGCPKCKISKGELSIIKILEEHSIEYINQKRFDGCINKRKLPFDFYLPDYNICIEFDGVQHFEPVKFRNYSDEKSLSLFEYIKHNDSIKNNYCLSNNIKLFRISHNDNLAQRMDEIIISVLFH